MQDVLIAFAHATSSGSVPLHALLQNSLRLVKKQLRLKEPDTVTQLITNGLDTPNYLFFDEVADQLYIVDQNSHSIKIVDPENPTKFSNYSLNFEGSDAKNLEYPRGLTMNSKRNFIIANNDKNQIVEYNPRSNKVVTVYKVNLPCGVCVDKQDNIYTATERGEVVKIHAADGTLEPLVKGLPWPWAVCFNPIDETKLIYGVYNGNYLGEYNFITKESTILAGDSQAGFVDSKNPLDARFQLPAGITLDFECIYIADRSNFAIRKMDLRTKEVSTITTGLNIVFGITVDFKRQRLYVSDWNRLLMIT